MKIGEYDDETGEIKDTPNVAICTAHEAATTFRNAQKDLHDRRLQESSDGVLQQPEKLEK
jgi:hypothetical protein